MCQYQEEEPVTIPLRIALWPLDVAAANGGEGLDADYYVTQFARAESNSAFTKYNCEFKPTDEQRDPQWH